MARIRDVITDPAIVRRSIYLVLLMTAFNLPIQEHLAATHGYPFAWPPPSFPRCLPSPA